MKRRFLSAEWRHLAMLNYEVDPGLLQPLVPRGTEIDSWKGRTFVSLVGFLFLGTRVLGVPVPFHRNFAEVNLRFYVRRRLSEGWRRGVVFVKEFVPKSAIAAVARWVYNENYVACRMASGIRLPDPPREDRGSVQYSWWAGTRWNAISVGFEGSPSYPTADSEEEFITEHYWGYAAQRSGSACEYHVEHPRWRVWRATSAQLDCDVQACYGRHYCAALGQQPSSAFVADGSGVAVFRGERLAAAIAEEPPLRAAWGSASWRR
jgi:uncharacterized protein YqjF (DUF2071 family)